MRSILIAFLALFALACASGQELVRLDVHTEGRADVATNLNAFGIVSDSSGWAMITTAQTPFLPIYPAIQFDAPVVILGTLDGELRWEGEPGQPIPFEFAAVAAALWIPQRIGQMGLLFEAQAPVPAVAQ